MKKYQCFNTSKSRSSHQGNVKQHLIYKYNNILIQNSGEENTDSSQRWALQY